MAGAALHRCANASWRSRRSRPRPTIGERRRGVSGPLESSESNLKPEPLALPFSSSGSSGSADTSSRAGR